MTHSQNNIVVCKNCKKANQLRLNEIFKIPICGYCKKPLPVSSTDSYTNPRNSSIPFDLTSTYSANRNRIFTVRVGLIVGLAVVLSSVVAVIILKSGERIPEAQSAPITSSVRSLPPSQSNPAAGDPSRSNRPATTGSPIATSPKAKDEPIHSSSTLPPAESWVSLPTGTNIDPPSGRRGLGSLRIINGSKYDAVAKLNGETTRRSVYIRADSEITLKGIGADVCVLKFATGADWDATKSKFSRDVSYSKFDDLFRFTETKTETATGTETVFSTFEITLHVVFNGNARTTSISEKEFDRE